MEGVGAGAGRKLPAVADADPSGSLPDAAPAAFEATDDSSDCALAFWNPRIADWPVADWPSQSSRLFDDCATCICNTLRFRCLKQMEYTICYAKLNILDLPKDHVWNSSGTYFGAVSAHT